MAPASSGVLLHRYQPSVAKGTKGAKGPQPAQRKQQACGLPILDLAVYRGLSRAIAGAPTQTQCSMVPSLRYRPAP